MSIARGDSIALMRELVRIDSRNPSLCPGAAGEAEAARVLAHVLRAWGLHVEVREVAPGRPNVIARTAAQPGRGPTLMFNGHLDTVGTQGMLHEPFGERRGERLYGRGSADMKGGVAAMCAAAARFAESGRDGEVIVTAVADEEYESIGTRALLEWGIRADAAVVTEPTRLAIAPAHRGFAWIEVKVHGRAAHGSRYDLGIDAIRNAGLLLVELDRLDRALESRRTHALLGRGSLHASTIQGGTGLSTYPDLCAIRIERRTIPGEDAHRALQEIETICESLKGTHPGFSADVTLLFAQPPSDVPSHAPVVRALAGALECEGLAARIEGLSAWTDAALLNAGGIPAVCFGPGDIALAHSLEEWIEERDVERAARALHEFALLWMEASSKSGTAHS